MEWVEKEKLRPGQTGVLKIYENAKAQEGKRERERTHPKQGFREIPPDTLDWLKYPSLLFPAARGRKVLSGRARSLALGGPTPTGLAAKRTIAAAKCSRKTHEYTYR